MMNEIWWPYPLVLVDLGLLIRPNRQHHSTFHVRTSQLHSLNWLSINQKCTLQRQKQHRLGPRIELTISTDNSKKSSCWSKSKASKPPLKGYWRVIWKRSLELAICLAHCRTWLCPTQRSLQRHSMPQIRLASTTFTISLCMWQPLQCGTCPQLPKRWISINSP